MNLAVIGVGHVGLVTAACLADLGHEVVGLDDDRARIDTLLAGGVPFHEPDLPQLIDKVTGEGLLRFTTDLGEAIAQAEVVFVCVGTPPLPGGGPDLRFVERVAVEVAAAADHELVLVEKSTVPANTGQRLTQVIQREQTARGVDLTSLHVASNPEFLREGAAVYDTLNPDRIVYGTSSEFARDALRRVYAPLVERTGAPVVETDVNTAELIKHASNAFLATKISFINAVANVCDIVGADVEVVAQGMGMDERIGPKFLQAGLGFGGSCLVPEESVLTRRGREVRYLRMHEMWSEVDALGIDGLEVLAWDPDTNRTAFLPCSAVTLRRYEGDVVEVRTKMGRRLRTTADHPFVVGDGTTARSGVKLAGELTADDWLPLAAGAPVNVATTADSAAAAATSNVLAAVAADVATPPEVIHRLTPTGLAAVRERASRLPTPRRYDVLRNGTIRLDEMAELELSPSGGSYGTAKNGTYVPDHIAMDEDFWRMVGLFLAEGHITIDGARERIAWSFHPTAEPDLVDFVANYWQARDVKVAVRRVSTTRQVSISSRLLAGWMDEVLGLGRNCYVKRLPNEIWSAPATHQRAVLRGLWDGDGSWSLVNGGPSVVLEYGTVSQDLADGMMRLLGHLGVVASVRTGRTAKIGGQRAKRDSGPDPDLSLVDTYWLRISGAEQVESAATWLFPPDEADEIRQAIAQQQKRIAPTGYRRIDGDTAWVRVTETRRERYHGPVYSLEVPGAHTVVSTGGLVTHNCFPKDVDAFLHLSRNVGYDFRLLEEVARINAGQRDAVLGKLRDELWHLSGKTITVLGAAFKPGTDDLRESPALHLARALADEGATVRIYDPVAIPGVRQQAPDLDAYTDPLEALSGAHAAVVATDWPEIVELDLGKVAEALDYPILVDGRNCLDPAAAKAAGLRYHGMGRGHLDV